jgi:maleylacetate reductase
VRFVHDQAPVRVVFGAGSVERVPDELARVGIRRCLILHGGSQAEVAARVCEELGERCTGTSTDVGEHVPVEVAKRARARAAGADGLLAVGGGSAIGVAKAVALTSGRPIVAVPTTYSGSEMTAVYGVTEGGRKHTGRDEAVRPRTAIYDADLVRGLPRAVAAASAMNALAHCVDAVWAPGATPVTTLLAEEGAARLRAGLERDAPEELLYGAALAGWVMGTAGTGLHHRICHVLGGAYGLSHAGTHSAVLPHVAALIPPALTGGLAIALGGDDLAPGIAALEVRAGAPTSLRELGMREADLDEAAALVVAEVGDEYDIRGVLERAFAPPSPPSGRASRASGGGASPIP